MVQEVGSPGEGGVFPPVEGKREAAGVHRETREAWSEAGMKCTYCNAVDHLETVCPTKAKDRRFELFLGILFFIPMLPFYVAGFLGGMSWSALKSGFDFTDGFWPQTWKAIRGKNKEDGDAGSV